MTTPTGPGTPEPGTPEPAEPTAPETSSQRNGLAIAGFILAIVAFPVGLVLSLIALVQTFRRNQKGKVLAVLGTVISLAELTVLVVALGFVVGTVSQNASTLLDPGCTQGKAVILENDQAPETEDPEVLIQQMDELVAGLDEAAAQAKSDEVRAALLALRDDYAELSEDLSEGTMPEPGYMQRVLEHGNAIDELCTLGGAEDDSQD
jgi:uncharacterized protein HemX